VVCEPCSDDAAGEKCKSGCKTKTVGDGSGGAQVHEGSDGVWIPTGRIGTMEAAELGGIDTWREAYILDDHGGMRDYVAYTLVFEDSSPDLPGVNSTGDDCGANEGDCLADDAYNYQWAPDLSLVTGPPAAVTVQVFTVENHKAKRPAVKNPPEPLSLTDQADCGRLFRELSVVGGQDRWVEHWILNPNCLPPSLDKVGADMAVDLVMKPVMPVGSRETTLKAFFTKVKATGGVCDGLSDPECRYAQLQFRWTEH